MALVKIVVGFLLIVPLLSFVGCQNGRQSVGESESADTDCVSTNELLPQDKPARARQDDPKCPPEVIKHVANVDLTSSDNSMLFSWIEENSKQECVVHCVTLVAKRLDNACDPQVISDFCGTTATYAKFIKPDARREIKAAYLRFEYNQSIARQYFIGLRYNQIDVRPQLKHKIKEDWSFKRPRKNAATWHYYLYLASLNEPGAYIALAKKLAATKDGNDATNLIKSLADLKTKQIKDILLKYKEDERHSDGPDGPGPTIAQTVTALLPTFPK